MFYNLRLLYDYLRLHITLLFMNTKRHFRRQKGSYSALLLHYFVKIQNVRMSIFEQKIIKRYSYFVSLNSVFKDATICS